MFTLLSETEVRALRERLRIGEVARLVGVTTKTVRHYEKVGLLGEPERSGSGYRLYTADDLLRLHRVRRLQSLGLSLDRIKGGLGEPGAGTGLREVLEALLAEVYRRRRDLPGHRRQDRPHPHAPFPANRKGLFRSAGPATTIYLAADQPQRLASELRERIGEVSRSKPPALA